MRRKVPTTDAAVVESAETLDQKELEQDASTNPHISQEAFNALLLHALLGTGLKGGKFQNWNCAGPVTLHALAFHILGNP